MYFETGATGILDRLVVGCERESPPGFCLEKLCIGLKSGPQMTCPRPNPLEPVKVTQLGQMVFPDVIKLRISS